MGREQRPLKSSGGLTPSSAQSSESQRRTTKISRLRIEFLFDSKKLIILGESV